MTDRKVFNCAATGIGTMPHRDAAEACQLINKRLKGIPYWPQLPKRTDKELMQFQYSEGFAGIIYNNGNVNFRHPADLDQQIEKLYTDYSEDKYNDYGMTEEYAAGLYAFSDIKSQSPELVKGHITGPVSWGLSVTDENGRGILYDDQMSDAAAKFLHLKAAWQENYLRSLAPNTIIFVDEPYLVSLGTASVAISNQQVIDLLEEVFSGISGIKGTHCCGATDWTLLLKSSVDILSFDTYNYADSLTCYPSEVNDFIKRGSAIAWGIVPNDEDFLKKETASSLLDRLGEAIAPFTRDGISFKQILAQSIVTPSCGLASVSLEAADTILAMLTELSLMMKSKYL